MILLNIRKKIPVILASVFSGLLAGIVATALLYSLEIVSIICRTHLMIIWFLPLAGFLIGWIFHRFGRDVALGSNLIIDEIHFPQKSVPLRMVPLVFCGTVLTHLFGGSAGREGAVVQMSAALADQVGKKFKLNLIERKYLLIAGAGAGFGAGIGAPVAGIIFGMEMIFVGRFRLQALVESTLASFVGYYMAVLLRAPHATFPQIEHLGFSWNHVLHVIIFGLACGLVANVFSKAVHYVHLATQKWIIYPPFRPMMGGVLLVILYFGFDLEAFSGLGISEIQQAFTMPAKMTDSFLKMLTTLVTVGFGFKGGEFVPLVFVGTTLGSAFSVMFGVGLPVLAALGFVSVFAGAANTPIACTILAMELFGVEIGGYALLSCLMSYLVSGNTGIYSAQKMDQPKWALFFLRHK